MIELERGWLLLSLFKAVAPDLREKLGEAEYASKCLGPIAPYFVERYSFDPQCKVITFTGDNLSSLAGEDSSNGVYSSHYMAMINLTDIVYNYF